MSSVSVKSVERQSLSQSAVYGTGLYFLGMPAWFSVSTLGTIVLSLLGVWYLLKKVFIDFEYEDEEEGGEE